jgi:putative FmdB family regulatory protein
MPTYDFKCEKCGTIVEELVPLTSITEIRKDCSICKIKEATMVRADSFTKSKPVFKGTGFYETDYKSNKG